MEATLSQTQSLRRKVSGEGKFAIGANSVRTKRRKEGSWKQEKDLSHGWLQPKGGGRKEPVSKWFYFPEVLCRALVVFPRVSWVSHEWGNNGRNGGWHTTAQSGRNRKAPRKSVADPVGPAGELMGHSTNRANGFTTFKKHTTSKADVVTPFLYLEQCTTNKASPRLSMSALPLSISSTYSSSVSAVKSKHFKREGKRTPPPCQPHPPCPPSSIEGRNALEK